MKKLIFALCLLFSATVIFTACNSGDSNGNNGNTPNSPTSETTKYTVSWVDENGNTLHSAKVEKGDIPSFTYNVSDTAEWDYTFVGWSESADGETISAIPEASKDVTYYAKVTKVKQKYTITFNSCGGSAVPAQTVEYGSQAIEPEKPTYEGYRFAGWSTSATDKVSVDFESAITENKEYFAVWNITVDVKDMLAALLNGYKFNPDDFIPESMRPEFSAKLVKPEDIVSDYSSSVKVSNIHYGHGEQWHMVLENLEESKVFFNVLNVVETVSTSSIVAFNNYFDSNPSDTAHYEFASGIYNVTIDFDGEMLYYVLDYTLDVPLLGSESAQIALIMEVETGKKTVRVQVGDANALSYTVLENSYTFAIKYLGGRRAMLNMEIDDDGNVSGNIYEYLGVGEVELNSSVADFYITDDYVTVVGNKADAIPGFAGYICELYDAKNGTLLGYEVKEKLLTVEYDTLWFNLGDISGINSIKHTIVDDKDEFYINRSSTKWETKKVLVTRKFDIEFKTQYVYSYDTEKQEYIEHEVQVPMIFVQEDHYDTFVSDVLSTNNVAIEVELETFDINKLLDQYDELIPALIEHKNDITSEAIVKYIGDKITF